MITSPGDLEDFALSFGITGRACWPPHRRTVRGGRERGPAGGGSPPRSGFGLPAAWRDCVNVAGTWPGAPAGLCQNRQPGTGSAGSPCTGPSVRLTSTAVLQAESTTKSAQMLQKLTGATHALPGATLSRSAAAARGREPSAMPGQAHRRDVPCRDCRGSGVSSPSPVGPASR